MKQLYSSSSHSHQHRTLQCGHMLIFTRDNAVNVYRLLEYRGEVQHAVGTSTECSAGSVC